MRLISGELGGRTLKTAKDDGLRPAMSKTREAIFSILESRGINWTQTIALDLFAGVGSLGLECLSRGADNATFVEKFPAPFECLVRNIESFSLQNRATLYNMDVLKFLRKLPETFFNPLKLYNLVFLDPPYRKNLASQCLNLLDSRILAEHYYLVAELEKEIQIPLLHETPADIIRNFGQTSVYIWFK